MNARHVGVQMETTYNPEVDRLRTEQEIAQCLQAARRTVINWRMQGKIPYIRVGRLIRYHWPSVVDHLRRTAPKHGGLR